MSEAKFTKGPWKIGTPGPNGCYTIGTNRGLMTAQIAHSINICEQRSEAIANANLIAAAPEMYEMLEDYVSFAERGDAEGFNQMLYVVKELLAKARGEK